MLTSPFAWRKRLGSDGPLLSALTRLFVKTVLDFYRERGGDAMFDANVSRLGNEEHVSNSQCPGATTCQSGMCRRRARVSSYG